MSLENEEIGAFVQRVAIDIQNGNANEADIKQVLYDFCYLVANGKTLPWELSKFFKNAFEEYMDGRAHSLDQAIGLVRHKSGRPPKPADDLKLVVRATDVLEARLEGNNHQEALQIVAERHHCAPSTVATAWQRSKGHAVPMLLSKRLDQGVTITASEWAKIRELFKKQHAKREQWFSEQPPTVAPEK